MQAVGDPVHHLGLALAFVAEAQALFAKRSAVLVETGEFDVGVALRASCSLNAFFMITAKGKLTMTNPAHSDTHVKIGVFLIKRMPIFTMSWPNPRTIQSPLLISPILPSIKAGSATPLASSRIDIEIIPRQWVPINTMGLSSFNRGNSLRSKLQMPLGSSRLEMSGAHT
jgi:hypothetical protein